MIPPQAPEVERSIIGAMLLDKGSLNHAFEVLKDVDFYVPDHQKIYRAMIDVHMAGDPVDIVTVGDKVDFDLTDFTTESTTNIEYSCQIVKERSMKRSIIQICMNATKQCYDEQASVYEALDQVKESLYGVDDLSVTTLHHIADTVQELSKRIMAIQETGEPIGIRSGLDIDNILQGFQDGKYYIIAARPSMGKTALVMTIMRELARSEIPTGIVSLETSHTNLGTRLVSQVSGIAAERITSGSMGDGEVDRFMNACQTLSGYGIQIDDGTGITAQQLRSKCYAMASKGAKIIFVDFLQLINEQGRSRHEEIGKISKACKAIAKDLSIPIVALSQLSRKVEDRTSKRPMLSDLRESGSLEEDADAVLFLYRAEYYGVKTDTDGESTEGIAEIIVAKNKDGRTGTRKHLFEKETMTFKNLTQTAPF